MRVSEQQPVALFLKDNHGKLVRLLNSVLAMVLDGEDERAEVHAQDLITEINLHLRAEEELLLPIFEKFAHFVDPCKTVRHEHALIREALKRFEMSLEQGHSPSIAADLQGLLPLLVAHHKREEGLFYSQADATLTGDESNALVRMLAHG